MKCFRFDLRKDYPRFIQGSLNLETVRKIEDHLAECEECRSELSSVLNGDQLARNLQKVSAPPHTWESIVVRVPRPQGADMTSAPRRIAFLAGVPAALALIIMFALLVHLAHRSDFDPSQYREVPLSQFTNTDKPHVTTEGYVSDIQVDNEEGDLMFKLVDNPHDPQHFVVCEIIAPIKLDIPRAGSRIRVYGVSRFDPQTDHQWYEVHPVVNIESVR